MKIRDSEKGRTDAKTEISVLQQFILYSREQ